MAARIGNVIYWLGCIIAALFVLAGVAEYIAEGSSRGGEGVLILVVFLVLGFVSWLIGRALRYILSAA
jgi:hypothetical protein